jgi:hypothetical protein
MTIVNADEAASSTKKNNGETLINIVLDETGSMNSCRESTISSFNEYVGGQKSQDGVCRVTMSMFSDTKGWGFEDNTASIRTLYCNTLVSEVKLLDNTNYTPAGGTNLYDAIGQSITSLEAHLATLDTVPNILMVIITDGEENSSTEYKVSDIKKMVQAKEAEGWTFVYLGANQNAWKVGQAFGLSRGQTKSYDTVNMHATMASVGAATMNYRSVRSANSNLSGTVDTDFFADEKKAD